MLCPGCKKDIPYDSIICPECKIYIKIALKNQKNCPFCNEKIETDAHYCKHCKKDLTADTRKWYQKKRYVIPLLLSEVLIFGFIAMSFLDFTLIFKEAMFRNNRIEMIAELANALDSYKEIDSLTRYEVTENKQVIIEFLTFSYNKRSLQVANYTVLKKLSPLLINEANRLETIKIVAHTPNGGAFISLNTIGDISKINIGTWDFIGWLQNTNFSEADLI